MGILSYLRKKFTKQPNKLTIDQIKNIAKILIIDDSKPTEIIENLKKEGWKAVWIEDLDALGNKNLLSSHIVCVDIMDVGLKLGLDNGMQLAKEIKLKYPEKKIVLYSTVSKQDIFDDAVDVVDKRLRKLGTPLPFTSAVEELAIKTLNWEDAIKYAYAKVLPIIGSDVTFENFRSAALKSTTSSLDIDKFVTILKVSTAVANTVAAMLKYANNGG